MKKTLLIALAGILLFTFAQCSGCNQVKGTKEYVECMELIDSVEMWLDGPTNCEELTEAGLALMIMSIACTDTTTIENDTIERMTEEEKAKVMKRVKELGADFMKKSESINCE